MLAGQRRVRGAVPVGGGRARVCVRRGARAGAGRPRLPRRARAARLPAAPLPLRPRVSLPPCCVASVATAAFG